jgi:ferredoxin
MRIAVDPARCRAYANCVLESPDIFDLHERTGKVLLREPATIVGPDRLAEVRAAVASCPVRAISLEEPA